MHRLVGVSAAALVFGGCASSPPATLSDAEVISACRSAAREHPRRHDGERMIIRELITRSTFDEAARLECEVDFSRRQILSARVNDILRFRGPPEAI